jgi:hypothetical protein
MAEFEKHQRPPSDLLEPRARGAGSMERWQERLRKSFSELWAAVSRATVLHFALIAAS